MDERATQFYEQCRTYVVLSHISSLQYVVPSNFSHRKERRLYSRWKTVFTEMLKLVAEGKTL